MHCGLSKRIQHAFAQGDIMRARRPARSQQGMNILRELLPGFLGKIEIVDRQDRNPKAGGFQKNAQHAGARRLAAALGTANPDDAATARILQRRMRAASGR